MKWLVVNLGAMVEVVGQRSLHDSQQKIKKIIPGRDLIGSYAHALVPDHDVPNRDATSGDAQLTTRNARRNLDVLV